MAAEPGSRGRIIVFGILFWYPLAGRHLPVPALPAGAAPPRLRPVLRRGLGPLGLRPGAERPVARRRRNVAAVAPVLEAHGFADRWAFRGAYAGGSCYGMTEAEILRLYREADAFLNVTGAQEIREEHLRIPRRIYVESDPFASQVKVANGEAKAIAALDAHDTHLHVRREHRPARLHHPGDAVSLAADAPAGARRPVAAHATPPPARRTRRSPPGTTRARTSR